jgi:hypothetical protein
VIIVKIFGGLGNQMFQYAAGKSLAFKNNSELKLDINHYKIKTLPHGLPYRTYDLSIFNIEENIATDKEIARFKNESADFIKRNIRKAENIISPHKIIYEPYFDYYSELNRMKGNLYIDGYWQSEKYFKDIENIIRKEFIIQTTMTKEGVEMLDKIQNSNSVCLNIRRQEFASNPHLNLFTGVEYIYKAVDYFKIRINNPHYFIFSDELDWVRENVKLSQPNTIVEDSLYGDKFRDCLYLMSSCKHAIIPNSTFGWWAGWLNPNAEKIVVAPQRWFSDDKRNTKDLIPEKWIRL